MLNETAGYFSTHLSCFHRCLPPAFKGQQVTTCRINLLVPTQNLRMQLVNARKNQILHGMFPNALAQTIIDKHLSKSLIQNDVLYPEIVGIFFSIQDKIVRTYNYERHTLRTQLNKL